MNLNDISNLESLEGSKRKLSGFYRRLVFSIGVVFGIFHLIVLFLYPIDPWIFRAVHLAGAGMLAFLLFPGRKLETDGNPKITDLLLAALLLSSSLYIVINHAQLVPRAGTSPTGWDLVFGIIAILGLLEVTRRTTGWALPILSIVFIFYAYWGNLLPGDLWHRGYSFERIVSYLFSTFGIYNIPLGVSATYVFIFILFGAFLESSGSGNLFMKLANAIAGKYRGGPAKVAVFSSGLMGTVSGSAVANVVSTGAFTIPMMKRVGYSSRFSGAVEAVSSAGGQILPPVMGAGAFIMADMTGIPYSTIVVAALVPAILYFLSVLFMVDFEAGKLGLRGIPKSELPIVWVVLKEQGFFLIPLLILIYSLIVLGYSPIRSATISIVSIIVISWFTKNKILFKLFFESISSAMNQMISIAATCATAGIIIGIFSLTGLGAKISRFIIALSGDNFLIVSFMVMLLCIILGMGLPTVAAYTIAASTVAPAMIEMGITALQAHLFIFYYACFSTITPPVALSAFAGAAIAGAKPMQVSWAAIRIGIVAFIIPFMFIINDSLLLQGEISIYLIIDTVTALIGIIAIAAGIQSYLFTEMSNFYRGLFLISAILLMIPIYWVSVPGLFLFIMLSLINFFSSNNKNMVKTLNT